MDSGQQIEQYRIERPLGRGGLAEVFLATDTRLDRPVALKFLLPAARANRRMVARFVREAKAAAKIVHPHIITVHEILETDDGPCIVMQYVEGGCLRDRLHAPDDTWTTRLNLLIHVAEGLEAAHEHGIVHRDIKPENLLLDRQGRIVVADFGLAQLAESSRITRDFERLGTLGYMAPEQIQGGPVDERADVFALAVVAYELLSGRHPFESEHEAGVLYAVMHEDVPALTGTDLPESLARTLGQALARDPAMRTSSVTTLRLQFQEALAGEDASAPAAAPRSDPHLKSLAVLYLKNLGAEEDEFISYGITEDLIVDLSRLGRIRVVPMRSILKYRESTLDLASLAHALKAQFILDGSIHRAANAVRVSAQLLDTSEDRVLWANRWEKPAEDLPQVKQALAEGVSEALQIDRREFKSAGVGIPETHDPIAYEYYLRGKYAFDRKQSTADLDVALGFYRRALDLDRELLAARAGVAEIDLHRGHYDQATEGLLSTVAAAREAGHAVDQERALHLLAIAHIRKSDWDQALEYAEQALAIARDRSDRAAEAEIRGTMIQALEPRARFDEALLHFNRVLEITLERDDQASAAEALKNMGGIRLRQGQFQAARGYYKRAAKIARDRRDQDLLARCISNIGLTHAYQGGFDAARRSFDEAIRIFANLEDGAALASVRNNMALTLMSQGEYVLALHQLEEGAKIVEALGNRGALAMNQSIHARLLAIQGQFARAEELARSSLAVARELEYAVARALTQDALGYCYSCAGRYADAVREFAASIEFSRAANLQRELALTLANQAEASYGLGAWQDTVDQSRESLEIARKIDERRVLIKARAYAAAASIQSERAGAHLEELRTCLAAAEAFGDPLVRVYVQRLLGGFLVEGTDGPDRVDDGRRILTSALELARAKGIEVEARRLEALIKETN